MTMIVLAIYDPYILVMSSPCSLSILFKYLNQLMNRNFLPFFPFFFFPSFFFSFFLFFLFFFSSGRPIPVFKLPLWAPRHVVWRSTDRESTCLKRDNITKIVRLKPICRPPLGSTDRKSKQPFVSVRHTVSCHMGQKVLKK